MEITNRSNIYSVMQSQGKSQTISKDSTAVEAESAQVITPTNKDSVTISDEAKAAMANETYSLGEASNNLGQEEYKYDFTNMTPNEYRAAIKEMQDNGVNVPIKDIQLFISYDPINNKQIDQDKPCNLIEQINICIAQAEKRGDLSSVKSYQEALSFHIQHQKQ